MFKSNQTQLKLNSNSNIQIPNMTSFIKKTSIYEEYFTDATTSMQQLVAMTDLCGHMKEDVLEMVKVRDAFIEEYDACMLPDWDKSKFNKVDFTDEKLKYNIHLRGALLSQINRSLIALKECELHLSLLLGLMDFPEDYALHRLQVILWCKHADEVYTYAYFQSLFWFRYLEEHYEFWQHPDHSTLAGLFGEDKAFSFDVRRTFSLHDENLTCPITLEDNLTPEGFRHFPCGHVLSKEAERGILDGNIEAGRVKYFNIDGSLKQSIDLKCMSCRDVVAAFGLKSYSSDAKYPRVYSMKMKPWLRKKFKEYEYKLPWSALGMTVTRVKALTRVCRRACYRFRGILSPANRRNVMKYGTSWSDDLEQREQEIISETSPNVLKFYENKEYSWTGVGLGCNGVTNRDLLKESDLSELQDNPFYEWKQTHDYIMTKNRIETRNDSDDSDFDEDQLFITPNPSAAEDSWKGHLLHWLPQINIFKTKLYYPNLIKESNPPHEDVYKIPFERERQEFLQFLMVFSSNFDNDEDSDWQITDSTWLHSVKRFLFHAEKIIEKLFYSYGQRIWFDYGDETGNFDPEEPLDDLTEGQQLAHEISTDLIHNLIDWEFGEKNLSSCFGTWNGDTGWYNIQRETSELPQHGWIYPFRRYLHHLNGMDSGDKPPNLIWNACMTRIRLKSNIAHMMEREIRRQHRIYQRDRQRELQRLVEAQVQESEAVQESPTETAEESPPTAAPLRSSPRRTDYNPDNTFDISNIDLDNTLHPENMDWSYDRPSVPHTVVYIFQVQESEAVQESPTETAEESPPTAAPLRSSPRRYAAEVQESQPPAPARHFYIIPGNPGNARLDLRGFSSEDANQVRQQLTTFLSDINVQNNTS